MASSVNSHSTEDTTCPLCLQANSLPFAQLAHGHYWFCDRCQYTYLSPSQWLSEEEEASHYHLHDNRIDDPQYLTFLSRLSNPLMALLPKRAQGLDVGCGPGPALAHHLTQKGFPCAYYDPLFFPNEALLKHTYDFITATEVVEHLRHPAATWALLQRLVKPGGILAIMTGWRVPPEQFPEWYYARDPTHIGFYQPSTFRWLAKQWQWEVQFPVANVCFFKRPH